MHSIIKLIIPYLLTTILTLCSLNTCSLPPVRSITPIAKELNETDVPPTVLPTPSRPWIVRNDSKSVCILAKFGAEFIINSTKSKNNFIINPMSAHVGNKSICGSDIQVLELVFNGMSLWFNFEKEKNEIFVSKIVYIDKSGHCFENNERVFKTHENFGYKCFNEQNITLNDNIVMTVENVRLEAFKSKNYNESYDDTEQWERVGLKCQLDRITSDAWKISGISVGVGVTVLTFITLVAVWSGRSQEKVMLKVKMMRQWTVEENLAFQNRIDAIQKKNGTNKNTNNNGDSSVVNPGYPDSESYKF